MGFCKFSTQATADNKTQIDNFFIENFLPYAQADCIKIYLYGLYACQNSHGEYNTIAEFSKALNISEEDIYSAFLYWQEEGLVTIIETMPFSVVYLPVKDSFKKMPKLAKTKYASFNAQMQELFSRMITPNEYLRYYELLQDSKMEQNALVMITKYCTTLKGDNVNYPYITTVAKAWAKDGILSCSDVEEKLKELEENSEDVIAIQKALKTKKQIETIERDLIEKWKTMGYNINTIVFVIKMLVKKGTKPNFALLDTIFHNYYTSQVYSLFEIEEFEETRYQNLNLAKDVCKNLGIYYQRYESVVFEFIMPWKNLGYDENLIEKISKMCFKNNIKTLDFMNKYIQKLAKQGIVDDKSYSEYISVVLQKEEELAKILETLNITRNASNFDRDCYKNWTENWNMPKDVIEYACTKTKGVPQAMVELNKILSLYYRQNIKTVEQAKDCKTVTIQSAKKQSKKLTNYSQREYTKEQLNAVFTNLDDVEI